MPLIKASYTVNRGQAYAGQIADTSVYNIDGTCAHNPNATAKLQIGRLVSVLSVQPIEGHKVVAQGAPASSKPLGIAVMSGVYSPGGEYEPGIAVNVMTHGRVWALAAAALTDAQAAFDNPVTFNADGVVVNGGAVATGWKFTGEVLASTDPAYKLVKIQVLQSATAPAAGA